MTKTLDQKCNQVAKEACGSALAKSRAAATYASGRQYRQGFQLIGTEFFFDGEKVGDLRPDLNFGLLYAVETYFHKPNYLG